MKGGLSQARLAHAAVHRLRRELGAYGLASLYGVAAGLRILPRALRAAGRLKLIPVALQPRRVAEP